MRFEERIREILDTWTEYVECPDNYPEPIHSATILGDIMQAIKDEGVEAWVAGYEAGREAERKYYDALCSFCDSPMSFKVCDECYLGET